MLFHQSRLMVVGQDRVGKTTWVQATVDGKNPSSDATSSTDGIDFTLVKCNLEDPECRFEVPDPSNEMEVIERAQARFIAKKIHEMDPNRKDKKEEKEKLAPPQQVVQEREIEDEEEEEEPQPDLLSSQLPTEIHDLTPNMIKLVGEELRKLRSADMETYDPTSEHYLLLRISDFAGQPMHYNSHVFFLSDTGLYIIIFDLTRKLDDIAKVLVGHKGVEAVVDGTGVDTNIDYLKTWMTSIANTKQSPQVGRVTSNASQEETPQLNKATPNASIEQKPEVNKEVTDQPITPLSPSVLFIGTKLDELHQQHETSSGLMTHIMDQQHKILEELTGSRRGISTRGDATEEQSTSSPKDENLRRNAAHICNNPMFSVDNYKTVSGSEQEFRAIRKQIVQAVMEQEDTEQLLPFSWILFELELYEKKKTCRHLSRAEYVGLACKHNIRPEDIEEVLIYFDKLGIVVYRPSSRLLSNTLIIDPDWLMRVFRSIIRIRHPSWKQGYKHLWDEVGQTGIISFSLIDRALKDEKLITSATELAFITELFQKFNLLVPYIRANGLVAQYRAGSLRVSQFLAPSLVKYNPDWKHFVPEEEINPRTAQVKPLFIRSLTGSIPDALFNQLVTACIIQYPVCPEVYRYFSRIHIDDRYDLLLFNCRPCQNAVCLPHELNKACGTIMISVMDTDSSTQDSVTVQSLCKEVLQHVLWALNDIKSTGLKGLQFALETSVYVSRSSSWTFQTLSGFCKRHQIKGCASVDCFEQLFIEDRVTNKEKPLAEALATWISKDGLLEVSIVLTMKICLPECLFTVGETQTYVPRLL